MNKYCDVEKFSNEYLHKVGMQFDNAIYEMKKDRFCVNAIAISENATNGDVIKAMFPSVEVKEKNNGYEVYLGIGTAIQFFNHQWWNAPYKGDNNGDAGRNR